MVTKEEVKEIARERQRNDEGSFICTEMRDSLCDPKVDEVEVAGFRYTFGEGWNDIFILKSPRCPYFDSTHHANRGQGDCTNTTRTWCTGSCSYSSKDTYGHNVGPEYFS